MDGLERGGEPWALELRAGVIHLQWEHGRAVSEGTAREVMAQVSALSSRRRQPLLVGAHWMEALGYKARNVFAAGWPLTRVAVIGTSPVDEVIFVFYVARHQPACPTQFFRFEAEAVRWLKTPARAAESLPVSGTGGTRG